MFTRVFTPCLGACVSVDVSHSAGPGWSGFGAPCVLPFYLSCAAGEGVSSWAIVISRIGISTEDFFIQNHNLRNGLATGKFTSLFSHALSTRDGFIYSSARWGMCQSAGEYTAVRPRIGLLLGYQTDVLGIRGICCHPQESRLFRQMVWMYVLGYL